MLSFVTVVTISDRHPSWLLVQFVQEFALEPSQVPRCLPDQDRRLGIVIAKPSRQPADPSELLISLAVFDGRLHRLLPGILPFG